MSSRVAATKAAIRAAVLTILEDDGATAVTFQHVSDTSGIGRATVYRHYSTVTDLLEDAFLAAGLPDLTTADGLSLRDRVRQILGRLADELTSPAASAVVLAVLDQARQQTRSRELRDAYVDWVVAQLDSLLNAAVAAGEMRPGADPNDVFDLLFGPVMARYFLTGEEPDPDFLDTIVNSALQPWLPTSGDH